MKESEKLLVRIEHIQRELEELKLLAEGREPVPSPLEGLWEGVEVEEELFREAEKSLFRQE